MKQNRPPAHLRTLLKRFDRLFGRLVLPWAAFMLALYIFFHSPARSWINTILGLYSPGCLFFCTYAWTATGFIQSLSALFLIVSGLWGAWVIVDPFDCPAYDRLPAFGISALTLIIVPAAFLGAAAYFTGQRFLRPPAGPLLSALPALAIAVIWLRRGWRPHRLHFQLEKPGPLLVLTSCLAALLLLSMTAVSLAHPPTGYDTLAYHGPMSVFLWQEGNLGSYLDRDPVTWALAHPGSFELWLGLLRMAGGDVLANIGQLPFAFLGCAAVVAFTRRLGLPQEAGLLAGSTFLAVPMVVMQSGMPSNDLAGASLWMSAAVVASRPVREWNRRWLGLLGACLGLVVTTGLEHIPAAGFILLFVLAALLRKKQQDRDRRLAWSWIAFLAVCFLGVVAPWWLRNVSHYGNPVYPQALPLIGRGFSDTTFQKAGLAFVPRQAAWLIYPLLNQHEDQSGIGAVFALTCLPGFVMAARRGQRQPVILFSVLTLGTLLAWWLHCAPFPGFLLGLIGLSMAFVPWALLSVPQNQRRLAAVLVAAAAIFSALMTFSQGLAPFARQSNQRAAFYNQVWGIDPAVLALSEKEGLLWETGYAPDLPEYAAYLPLLGSSGMRLVIPSHLDSSTDTILARMQKNQLEYVYVPASPSFRSEVEKLFNPQAFELVSQSKVMKGKFISPRHSLYRPATAAEENLAITRYLFRRK